MVDFDYKIILGHLQVKYGVNPYFKIEVVPNPASPGNSSIAILPAGLGLPDRSYYYMQQNNSIVTAYKQLIRDVVINLSAPKTLAEKFGRDIFFYEQRIAEITPESIDLKNPLNTFNPIKVSELKFTTPTLPLQDILTAMFPSANIDGETEIIVAFPDYLLRVSQIISSSDRTTMNSYMMWTLVREYLPYLSSQFTAAMDAFNSELLGIQKPLNRWEFCSNLVQKFMPVAVDAMLDKQQPISDKSTNIVQEIFKNTKSVLQNHLNKYKSLPDLFELYTHLEKKASQLKLQIGLPDNVKSDTYMKTFYSKLIILKANLFESYKNGINFLKKIEETRFTERNSADYAVNLAVKQPIQVHYLPSSNTIIVPRSLLSNPYFDENYPRSVIYGRIGAEIANAMVSSIMPYDNAWSSDYKLLTPFHLTVNESNRLIRYPRHCLSDFITKSKYTVSEKANLTSLDTYKYLSSLNIAHEALNLAIEKDTHLHQPSLEIYEDSDLFYLVHIQNLCTITSKQQELYDNLVHFKLTENSLLNVAWHQHKLLATTFKCDSPGENQCSDIF